MNPVDEPLPQSVQFLAAIDVALGALRRLGAGKVEVLGVKLDGGPGKARVRSGSHCREETVHSADGVARRGAPVEPEAFPVQVLVKCPVCLEGPAGHTQKIFRHLACKSLRRVGRVVPAAVADHENGVEHPERLAIPLLATAEGDHGSPGEVPESTFAFSILTAVGVEDAVAEDEGIGVVQTIMVWLRDPIGTPQVAGRMPIVLWPTE